MENIAAFWILTGRIHLNKIMLILVLVGYIMNLVFIAALMIVIVSDRLKRKIVKEMCIRDRLYDLRGKTSGNQAEY